MPGMSKTTGCGRDSTVRGREAAGAPTILFAGEETPSATPDSAHCATCHAQHAQVIALLEELVYLSSGRHVPKAHFLRRVYDAAS